MKAGRIQQIFRKGNQVWKGRKHTEETKRKMSISISRAMKKRYANAA